MRMILGLAAVIAFTLAFWVLAGYGLYALLRGAS